MSKPIDATRLAAVVNWLTINFILSLVKANRTVPPVIIVWLMELKFALS